MLTDIWDDTSVNIVCGWPMFGRHFADKITRKESKRLTKKKKSEREKKETVMGSLIGWFAAFNVSLIIDSSFLFSQRI